MKIEYVSPEIEIVAVEFLNTNDFIYVSEEDELPYAPFSNW